jgi:hypothetical protein
LGSERFVAQHLGDEDAAARPTGDETEVLQHPVCLEHRVWVDREGYDHLVYVRELVPDVENPETERVVDLLDDLLVRSDARTRVEMKLDHPDSIYLGT